MTTGYPEFQPPKGWESDEQEGEALVKWKRKPSGTICIVEFDGNPLSTSGGEYKTANEELDAMAAESQNPME